MPRNAEEPHMVEGVQRVRKKPVEPYLEIPFSRLSEMFSEISLLEVPAGVGIKEHPHTQDEEWYIVLSCKGVELLHCACGESHSYHNCTGDTVWIIAIKRMVQ